MKHKLTQEDRLAGTRKKWEGYQKLMRLCPICGKEFSVPPSVVKKGKGKYCSQVCANGQPRSKKHHEKTNGYVYIKNYDHPYRSAQNLVAEHRLVAEKTIGRFLTVREVVHHIDKNRHNNEPGNLFLCRSELEHRRVERLDRAFVRMFNCARIQYPDDFAAFDITKNRQDQVQEMIGPFPHSFDDFVMWHGDYEGSYGEIDGPYSLDIGPETSMEQLWLTFLMQRLHQKRWDTKQQDWVKE